MWNTGKARIPRNVLFKLLTDAPLRRSYFAEVFDGMFVGGGMAALTDHPYDLRETVISRAMDGFFAGDPPVGKIVEFLIRYPMEMSVDRTRRYVVGILLVLALMTVVNDEIERGQQ